jgi:hypothetical protein
MSSQPRHEIALKTLVYRIAGADAVTVRRDVVYRMAADGPLTLDVYYPPGIPPELRPPAVLFVIGYSDAGARARIGCAFKEMESFIGWARLAAMSGLAAIAYTTSREPAVDLEAILRYVRVDAASLGIDADRLGVWACSGHGPNALAALLRGAAARIRCAVLYYAYTLDAAGSTGVADAAATWNFAMPCAGKSVADLADDVRLFIARAGLDATPDLNATLDRFILDALAQNLDLTIHNHPLGPHGFDVSDDSEATREVIRQTLAFMRFHLLS